MKNLMRTLPALLFLFWNFQNLLFSQTTEVDSLRNELSKNLHDTARLNVLLELSHHVMRTNPTEGKEYATTAIALAQSLRLPKKETKGLVHLSKILLMTGDYKAAKKLAKEAHERDAKNGNVWIGDISNVLGNIAYMEGHLDSAMTYFQLMATDRDVKKKITGYSNLGIMADAFGIAKDTVEIISVALRNCFTL